MALRNIRTQGDPILGKKCKVVTEMTERVNDLIDDMLETMYEAQGVGLAAPQVGILKRICVIDVSEEGDSPICLINPVIESRSEETQTGLEGCLSVPGKSGTVTRAMKVKVSYQDRNMKPCEIEGEGLLARALQHEIDHLDGNLYVTLVEGRLYDNSELEEE
ncbi:MAG: peptide deformylase [Lachnospiraceae bacterium]